jgi:hypothetical protein
MGCWRSVDFMITTLAELEEHGINGTIGVPVPDTFDYFKNPAYLFSGWKVQCGKQLLKTKVDIQSSRISSNTCSLAWQTEDCSQCTNCYIRQCYVSLISHECARSRDAQVTRTQTGHELAQTSAFGPTIQPSCSFTHANTSKNIFN